MRAPPPPWVRSCAPGCHVSMFWGWLCALGLALVALRVAGLIAWPWWLVTLPIWIGPALIALIALMVIAAFGLAVAGGERRP